MKAKYTLKEYVALVEKLGFLTKAEIGDVGDAQVEYLTFNSKKVIPGTLFICKGMNFREEYLHEAIERGAICYISEVEYPKASIPAIIVSDIRKVMAPMGEMCFNAAWKDLITVGVGGTKGKSTTTYYVKAIVDDYLAATGGKESGVISTIDIYDGVELIEAINTTPEAVELQERMRRAVDSGITHMEIEVSSQALKYNRVDNMRLTAGIFVNISEDHISAIEHEDYDDYLAAKNRIFEISDNSIVCLDTERIDEILEAARRADTNLITYSAEDPSADYYVHDIRKEGGEIKFVVKCASFEEEFAITMPGIFNAWNATAAIAACEVLGIPREYMHSGLYRARTSGRMEPYTSEDGNVTVIVDYAHNTLSYTQLYKSVEQEYPGHDIVTIYGCAGYKAMNRRKDLGEVAGKHSTKVIICAEDPGREPFEHIAEQASYYVREQGCPCEVIEDRGVAICKAVMECRRPTVILITGKGNETRDRYGAKYIPRPSDGEFAKMFIDMYNKAPFHALKIPGNETIDPEEYEARGGIAF